MKLDNVFLSILYKVIIHNVADLQPIYNNHDNYQWKLSQNPNVFINTCICSENWQYQLIGPWEIWMEFWISNFLLISVSDGCSISCEMAPRWILLDFTDDKSILVQEMAWCYQAIISMLTQMSPYGITRQQWVNMLIKLWSAITELLVWGEMI